MTGQPIATFTLIWKNGITDFHIFQIGKGFHVIDVCREGITEPGTAINDTMDTFDEAAMVAAGIIAVLWDSQEQTP